MVQTVILKPVITEQSLKDAQKGKYTFLVAKNADKADVKVSVEKLFGVSVKDIYTGVIRRTKTFAMRAGRRTKKITLKKARVTLAKDQKIDLFFEKGE